MNKWENALNRVMESTDEVRNASENFKLVKASRLQVIQEVWETESSALEKRYGSVEQFVSEWQARIERVANSQMPEASE